MCLTALLSFLPIQDEVTQCRFGSSNSARFIPALASMTNLQGNISLQLWNYNVTAVLRITSDQVSLVYIGASNMSGSFLLKVFIHTVLCF